MVPRFKVRFQENLEVIWVLLALFSLAVLMFKHCPWKK